MKNTILVIALVVVLGGIGLAIQFPEFIKNLGTTEYITKTETVEVEVTPEWAKDADAVKAAEDVIKKKELEAELMEVNSNIDELNARKDELESQLSLY